MTSESEKSMIYELGTRVSCYLCLKPLTPTNSAEEHLLLNALGGKLKSKLLICKVCNSGYGESIDAALAKQLAPLATLLNVKRDRGQSPSFKAKLKASGEEIIIKAQGRPEMTLKPPTTISLDDKKINYKLTAPNLKWARKQLEGLKKKHPSLDIEQELKNAVIHDTGPYSEIEIKLDGIGGPSTRRSACKSVLNFYLLKQGDYCYIQHIVSFIKGNESALHDQVGFFYPTQLLYPLEKDQITHSLSVVGWPKHGILFGHIEYFNVLSYLIVLNENYMGPEIFHSYVFDVVNTTVLPLQANFDFLTTREILRICNRTSLDQEAVDGICDALRNFMSKFSGIQQSRHIEEIIRRACCDLNEGDTITEKNVERMVALLMEELVSPLIQRKYDARAQRDIEETGI